jgi:hypothetical protein
MAPHALAALIARAIALAALAALGLPGDPVHAAGRQRSVTVTERSGQNSP